MIWRFFSAKLEFSLSKNRLQACRNIKVTHRSDTVTSDMAATMSLTLRCESMRVISGPSAICNSLVGYASIWNNIYKFSNYILSDLVTNIMLIFIQNIFSVATFLDWMASWFWLVGQGWVPALCWASRKPVMIFSIRWVSVWNFRSWSHFYSLNLATKRQ